MAIVEVGSLLSSQQFYDMLAPTYPQIAGIRLPYLDSIDSLVIERALPLKPEAYLDVGCGDGRRTRKIAGAIASDTTIGLDESVVMLELATGMEKVNASIVEFQSGQQFDVITALWNVWGHIGTEMRKAATGRVASLLSPEGLFMLDVNNRYNITAYGQALVQANRSRDARGETSVGDVPTRFQVGDTEIITVGHVFHPDEIDNLLKDIPELQIAEKTLCRLSNWENR